MRYVAYVRISSEEQRGNYSLSAQKHAIESWIAKRPVEQAGHLVRLDRHRASYGALETIGNAETRLDGRSCWALC